MKQFFAFIQKEFYHILRDRRTMMILLVMPVAQILLFGFAISTEVKDVRVAVYNTSDSDLTRRIIDRVDASQYFDVTALAHSQREIETLFRQNKVDLAIVFGDGTIQLIADGTDPNIATLLTAYATNIVSNFMIEQQPAAPNAMLRILPEVKLLYNPQQESAYNFVPGVMGLILMLICAMMTSISIVREKERGTMEVLLVSPIRPIYIILAKAVPYLALSAVSLILILLLSIFVLNVPVAGSLFWLSFVSVLYIMVALALGLLISTVVNTQVAAMLFSGMGLMMPVMLLSGMIFPVESMPEVLQWISAVIPARWYIVAVKKIMIEGLEVSFALKEIVILAVMACLLVAISLKKFKYRLQ